MRVALSCFSLPPIECARLTVNSVSTHPSTPRQEDILPVVRRVSTTRAIPLRMAHQRVRTRNTSIPPATLGEVPFEAALEAFGEILSIPLGADIEVATSRAGNGTPIRNPAVVRPVPCRHQTIQRVDSLPKTTTTRMAAMKQITQLLAKITRTLSGPPRTCRSRTPARETRLTRRRRCRPRIGNHRLGRSPQNSALPSRQHQNPQ